jgi:hypothetical protein
MIEKNIASLEDKQALVAVNRIVDFWLKDQGAVALRDVERVRLEAERQKVTVPPILIILDIENVTREQGEIARELLEGFLKSSDPKVREWCRASIAEVSGTKAQLDPLTAGLIVTGLFSAMVLVSKVYTDKEGRIRLAKLNKGDVAAIAGIAAAIFTAVV